MRGSTSERRDRPRPVGYQYHIITMGQAIRTKRRRKWRSDVLIQEKARHSKSQSSTGGTIPPLPTGPDHHQQCPPEGFRNRTPPDQIKQFVSPTISTEASPPPPRPLRPLPPPDFEGKNGYCDFMSYEHTPGLASRLSTPLNVFNLLLQYSYLYCTR